MKLLPKILIGVATVGVTITLGTLAVQAIRKNYLGKGVADKDATPEDKNNINITFVR